MAIPRARKHALKWGGGKGFQGVDIGGYHGGSNRRRDCRDLVCRAGPQGAVLYGWMAGGMGHPCTADDEGWQKFLAERGAQEIVLPPPKLPPWFGKTSVLLNPVGEKA